MCVITYSMLLYHQIVNTLSLTYIRIEKLLIFTKKSDLDVLLFHGVI